jgi:phosphatidylglycerophosphate synthase
MPCYVPTSRRPIAAVFRRTAEAATQFCVRNGIHPDAISYLSILAAAIAALCFWKSGQTRWLLIVAPLFCFLRLWFNMLDGMVAAAANKANRRGEIVNDLPDRVSDIVIFVGGAHSRLMNPLIRYWTAILAVFTAYVGLFRSSFAWNPHPTVGGLDATGHCGIQQVPVALRVNLLTECE